MSNSRKLKKPSPPKLTPGDERSRDCIIQNEAVYFNFRYITKNKNHNLTSVEKSGNKQAYKKLLEQLVSWSQFSWADLGKKGKRNGGFETMYVSDMKTSIIDQVSTKNISEDTKLHVFSFGDFRLVGLKGRRCSAVLHVLGFDWDFSLYDHG